MMQRCLRFEIIDSHSRNFKNLNATTRQQMALQGKKKKERKKERKSSNGSWTHRVYCTSPCGCRLILAFLSSGTLRVLIKLTRTLKWFVSFRLCKYRWQHHGLCKVIIQPTYFW
jgi:hypothetical protein